VATQHAAEVAAPRPAAGRARAAPGIAIAVIAGAQLMVALDVTIVNIALPHIQAALHFSRAELAWVIDAYTLVFGSLMLLGGRAADFLGRKRMFITGLALFAVASLAGGLADSADLLIGARAVQGVGAAVASPTALSLVMTVFTGHDTGIAWAAYSMFFQIGGAIGLAALTTVASTAIRRSLPSPPAAAARHPVSATPPAQVLIHALAHGWGAAFAAGAGFTTGRRAC